MYILALCMFMLYFVLRPVHTTPEKFENEALFLGLGLPSTLIQLFENALQTGGIENADFAFYCGRKTFRKRHDKHMVNPDPQGWAEAFLS